MTSVGCSEGLETGALRATESDDSAWLDPLTSPNPALPQLLPAEQAHSLAWRTATGRGEAAPRIRSLLEDRGPGPSGEAPPRAMLSTDRVVDLDADWPELRRQLSRLTRRKG